jgi:hypothetical protein
MIERKIPKEWEDLDDESRSWSLDEKTVEFNNEIEEEDEEDNEYMDEDDDEDDDEESD